MVLSTPATALSVLLISLLQPAQGPSVGPPAPITAQPRCQEAPVGSDEVVVCGQRPVQEENSPYRVPREFRNVPSNDDRDASHAARQQDLQSLERFDSQTIGGSGYLQRSRQRDCEWRAARQEAQGRRPDCTRRDRPDQPDDWQRQRRP
jgi:hypothetical protein